jgi:hypothetical protein
MIDSETMAELRTLAADLSKVWRDPTVTSQQRKAIVRLAIKRVHLYPGSASDTWPMEIEWENGLRTRIALTLEDRAPHRVARPRILRPPWRAIDPSAYPFIRERVGEGLSVLAIAEALNRAEIRHPRGPWGEKNVRLAVKRLRDGQVPGVEPLLAPPSLTERVRALHSQGQSPAQIVSQLRAQQVQTRRQTLVTREVVYKALERLRLPAHVTLSDRRVRLELQAAGGSATAAQLADRLNGLGLLTKSGRPWTSTSVRPRCRKLDLPFRHTRHTASKAGMAEAPPVTPGVEG